jgi:hypothetical protein
LVVALLLLVVALLLLVVALLLLVVGERSRSSASGARGERGERSRSSASGGGGVLGEASASEQRRRRARRGEREVAVRLARVRLRDAAKCVGEKKRGAGRPLTVAHYLVVRHRISMYTSKARAVHC